jgi:hypothetical protein
MFIRYQENPQKAYHEGDHLHESKVPIYVCHLKLTLKTEPSHDQEVSE